MRVINKTKWTVDKSTVPSLVIRF